MTAKIMVVDDKPTNLLLMENKLANEMYSVVTVGNSTEVVELAKEHNPDVILLDVVMPEMDGIAVCDAIKHTDEISHIPVLLHTGLDAQEDKIRGLEVGADDFLTIPINDIVLFSRLKSLVRMKMLMDELRMRNQTATRLLGQKEPKAMREMDVAHARILVVEDDKGQAEQIKSRLGDRFAITLAANLEETLDVLQTGEAFDLMVVSSYLRNQDGVNLVSFVKRKEATRNLPVIMMVNERNTQTMLRCLQQGIDDFLFLPVDYSEMYARIQTQVRRKRYKEALTSIYKTAESETLIDPVTGVFNTAYFNEHLKAEVEYAELTDKPLTLMLVDVAGFAAVNEELGRAGGDLVMREIARKMMGSTRTGDIVMRYEDDTFAVILPDTDLLSAQIVVERFRNDNKLTSVTISGKLTTTETSLNIGLATFDKHTAHASPESLINIALEDLGNTKKAKAG